MRYENITLQNLEFVDEDQANYECLSTDELIDITNNIRKDKGNQKRKENKNEDHRIQCAIKWGQNPYSFKRKCDKLFKGQRIK